MLTPAAIAAYSPYWLSFEPRHSDSAGSRVVISEISCFHLQAQRPQQEPSGLGSSPANSHGSGGKSDDADVRQGAVGRYSYRLQAHGWLIGIRLGRLVRKGARSRHCKVLDVGGIHKSDESG